MRAGRGRGAGKRIRFEVGAYVASGGELFVAVERYSNGTSGAASRRDLGSDGRNHDRNERGCLRRVVTLHRHFRVNFISRDVTSQPRMPIDEREWNEKRLEVAYFEARAVLDAQRETLADIDEKALGTVRITVLIFGAAVSVGNLEPGALNPLSATVGGGFLLLSVGFGVLTYNESDIYLGVGDEYVSRLATGDFDDVCWECDLARTYGGFVSASADEIDANARLLLAEQLSLVVGLLWLSVAVVV